MTIQLFGELVALCDLASADRTAMFTLLTEHFAGVTPANFQRDLAGKEWVILLRDGDRGCLQGFSTLALYTTCYNDQPISVIYSGDTIIRPAYWGTPALPRTWIQSVLRLSATMPQPLYWLLISSGYKTYRFLSVFYREFYPCYRHPTPPALQRLVTALATERFGNAFDAERGIVRFCDGATPLQAGIADLTAERLQDPHIAYFVERNPGHAAGDELVCLTQIHPDNFTAAGRRMAR